MKMNKKGFTLIELLIVVAIIAILAAIAIPQFSAYKKRGYAAELNSDAKNALTALSAKMADNTTITLGDCSGNLPGYTQSPNVLTCTSATAGAGADYSITIVGKTSTGLTTNTSYINTLGSFTPAQP